MPGRETGTCYTVECATVVFVFGWLGLRVTPGHSQHRRCDLPRRVSKLALDGEALAGQSIINYLP